MKVPEQGDVLSFDEPLQQRPEARGALADQRPPAACGHGRRGAKLAQVALTVRAAVRAQLKIMAADIEQWVPIATIPLTAAAAVAIVAHAERPDLAVNAFCASTLMSIGQMALFVASDVVSIDRSIQTLELTLASPSSYFVILLSRVLVITLVGLLGVPQAWCIVELGADVRLSLHHPWVFIGTLAVTWLAATCTAILTSSLFALGRSSRTFQNAVNGPLYLLGGVLVPTTYLPALIQPLCPFVFFYWSAALIRDSMSQATPANIAIRLGAIVALAAAAGTLGAWVLHRMLWRLRQDGTVSLS